MSYCDASAKTRSWISCVALVAAVVRQLLHGVGESVVSEIRIAHAPGGVRDQHDETELDERPDHV